MAEMRRDAVRHKGKGPNNAGKGSNPRRGSNPAKGQGKPGRQGSRGKGRNQPAVPVENETSTEHGSEFETGALSEEQESDEGRAGSNRSSASVGTTAMAGAITAAVAESVVAGAVLEQDSTAVVALGDGQMSVKENHHQLWFWFVVLYLAFSVVRDILMLLRKCYGCFKISPATKVTLWTAPNGSKIHLDKECRWLALCKDRLKGHEMCLECAMGVSQFICTTCAKGAVKEMMTTSKKWHLRKES